MLGVNRVCQVHEVLMAANATPGDLSSAFDGTLVGVPS